MGRNAICNVGAQLGRGVRNQETSKSECQNGNLCGSGTSWQYTGNLPQMLCAPGHCRSLLEQNTDLGSQRGRQTPGLYQTGRGRASRFEIPSDGTSGQNLHKSAGEILRAGAFARATAFGRKCSYKRET